MKAPREKLFLQGEINYMKQHSPFNHLKMYTTVKTAVLFLFSVYLGSAWV